MPWVNSPPQSSGLKGRENLVGSEPTPTQRNISCDPSGRVGFLRCLPRASSFGLSPGLNSPGPLGRKGKPAERPSCSTLVVLLALYRLALRPALG